MTVPTMKPKTRRAATPEALNRAIINLLMHLVGRLDPEELLEHHEDLAVVDRYLAREEADAQRRPLPLSPATAPAEADDEAR